MATAGKDDHGRVFDWLGVDELGTPYHLHPLNLVWSADGAEHDLNVYKRVADRLGEDEAYWSAIIRDSNWRFTLVGCVCLLVAQNQGHVDDLCFRFEAGSMVVPQLAVTLGLLTPDRARPFFERVLNDPKLSTNPSKAASAARALIKMGVRQPREVPMTDWKERERNDADVAEGVVEQHWAFWSKRCT